MYDFLVLYAPGFMLSPASQADAWFVLTPVFKSHIRNPKSQIERSYSNSQKLLIALNV